MLQLWCNQEMSNHLCYWIKRGTRSVQCGWRIVKYKSFWPPFTSSSLIHSRIFTLNGRGVENMEGEVSELLISSLCIWLHTPDILSKTSEHVSILCIWKNVNIFAIFKIRCLVSQWLNVDHLSPVYLCTYLASQSAYDIKLMIHVQ